MELNFLENSNVGSKLGVVFGPTAKGHYVAVSGEIGISKKGNKVLKFGGYSHPIATIKESKFQGISFYQAFESLADAQAFTSEKKAEAKKETDHQKLLNVGEFLFKNGGKIEAIRSPKTKKAALEGKVEARWTKTELKENFKSGFVARKYVEEISQSHKRISKWVLVPISELPNNFQDEAVMILENLSN